MSKAKKEGRYDMLDLAMGAELGKVAQFVAFR